MIRFFSLFVNWEIDWASGDSSTWLYSFSLSGSSIRTFIPMGECLPLNNSVAMTTCHCRSWKDVRSIPIEEHVLLLKYWLGHSLCWAKIYSAIFNHTNIHDNTDISVDESSTIPKKCGVLVKCGEAKPSVLSGDRPLALSFSLEHHAMIQMVYV